MFPNKNNMDKHVLDETLFPFGLKKSESDVVNDLFLAVQKIVAGTATVSNVILSETCFLYKINLSAEFPIITLQYETKSDINIEITPTIPVVIDEYSGLHSDTTESSNEIDYDKLKKTSFPFCNIKKEIPEILRVLEVCEVVADEKLMSYDCSQNKLIRDIQSKLNVFLRPISDSINKCDVSVGSMTKKKLNVTTTMFEAQGGNCINREENNFSRPIVKEEMKNHVERSNLNEDKHSCSYCGKLFKFKSAKKWHERIHTGEKPFQCEKCGRCFTKSGHLKRHTRIHTGEKPFMCEKCGKTFSQLENLNIHKRSHTGDKPFTCEECGKAFSQSSYLNSHKIIHKDKKSFSCKDCGKFFTYSRTLIRHKKLHTAGKLFKCEECGKAFTQQCYLNKHKKKYHL